MTDTRIDVVTKFSAGTPSLENLLQGIRHADESWDVHVHRLERPQLPTQNKLSSGLEHGLLTLQTFWTGLKLRTKSDFVIIHKTLRKELIEALFGVIISERIFLSFENTVHSTFDANYVHNPEKSALLFKKSDLVWVTSRQIKREVEKHTTEEFITFIPLSIDTELFNPEYSNPYQSNDDEELVLGWVGNIEAHEENVRLLADTLGSIDTDDIRVRLLYGTDEFPDDLEQQLRDTGASIDLLEFVPHEQVPAVINGFDVGVAPLRDTEFARGRSSVKIREYMACGVPVIASEVGENQHLVPNNTGFIVDDSQDWQNALESLSDAETRQEMGENARKHVVKDFSIPVISEKIRSEFQKLL